MSEEKKRVAELDDTALSKVAGGVGGSYDRVDYAVNEGACVYCGACVELCPIGAISMGPSAAQINQTFCTGCGICADSCAPGAIYFM